MESAASVLREVERRGGALIRAGPDRLRIQGPPAVDAALRTAVAEHKPELLRLLEERSTAHAPEQGTTNVQHAGVSVLLPPTESARPRLAPPNTTPTPDVFFDEIAPSLKEGELRVMLYLIRRTYGFKKGSDQISLSQFCEGIRTSEGKQLDRGTGLGRRHVVAALESLEQRDLVRCVHVVNGGRGHSNTYELNVAHYHDQGQKEVPKGTG